MRNADELRRARSEEAELEAIARQLTRTPKEQARYERLKASVSAAPYSPGDPCGVDGVERELESILRGTRGTVVESVGRRGGHADHVEITPPKDGRDVELSLDVNLQRAAEEILREGIPHYAGGALRGALVVLDVNTGDVLAAAAQPDFVREDLKDKDRFAKLLRLDNDSKNPLHPLHHRAYRPWLPPTPGSTFKIVTALAALEEGLVKLDTQHRCDGKVGTLRCDGIHGSIDLSEAMEVSCNVYFGWLGERLGLERLRRHSERFGLGQRTSFDRLEVKGGFEIAKADAELLRRCGVGYQIGTTPLQVARAYAAIANGGKVLELRAARKVGGAELPVKVVRSLGYPAENLDAVRESLRRVVYGDRGTARETGLSEYRVAGKTGTAEVDSKRDLNHAWFAGYAPLDRPRVAFAVYAELVPLHGKEVAPLVRSLLGHPAMAPYLTGE
jgi:penicillin-binding protein 2